MTDLLGRSVWRREAAWFAFNGVGSLICAIVIAVFWGWNAYLVWAVIWGACSLARVARLARRT